MIRFIFLDLENECNSLPMPDFVSVYYNLDDQEQNANASERLAWSNVDLIFTYHQVRLKWCSYLQKYTITKLYKYTVIKNSQRTTSTYSSVAT